MTDTRVRFAPSPTGYLHIGGLRTALYDYLFARATGGKFILRIEDTDRNRLVEDATDKLIQSLLRMGIELDEGPGIGGDYGPYIQSERLKLYHREAQRLVESGHAYYCFCSSQTLAEMREQQQQNGEFVKYDRRCSHLSPEVVKEKLASGESHVLRLRMPDERKFRFNDLIRGDVEMDSSQSDDQVIIKSDGFPTYHLAAVVDDHYMKISHVIRGEEWLSSTPKHIWLYECLGWDAPLWVHLPLILNTDRSKLSKRMNDVSVDSYLEKGYLKEALINFIALLGWHSADDREIYNLDELCDVFSLDRVSKAGAVFDLTKLDWMNGQYLRQMDLDHLIDRAMPFFESKGYSLDHSDRSRLMLSTARERSTLLPELVEYCEMFLKNSKLEGSDLETINAESSQAVLKSLLRSFDAIDPKDVDELNSIISQIQIELSVKGKLLYTPIRLALIRQAHGPDIFSIYAILGREEALKRLQSSIN